MVLLVNKHKLIKFTEYNKNKILEKWERIGLLIGLTMREKLELSLLFEKLLNALRINNINKSGDFVTMIFPILRRVYVKNKGKEIDVRRLIVDTRAWVNSPYFKHKMEYHNSIVDMEAELVADYADKYRP